MRTIKTKVACLISIGLGLFGILGSSMEGSPVVSETIPGLVSKADVIVVGVVSSVAAESLSSTGQLVLNVSDVFKGSYTSGVLSLSYEAKSDGTEKMMTGKTILAFGKLSADGLTYALLPMSHGAELPVRRQVMDVGAPADVPTLQISSQDTPLQKVIKELGLIQIGSTKTEAGRYLLSLTFAKVEPGLTEAVFGAIQSSGPKGAVLGAAGLVAMGDFNGLHTADSLDVQSHPELIPVISSIESSFNDTSKASLQILTQWLGSSMPAVKREAAAGALARIHTPGAILQLGVALNDSDFEVRWRAIGGLSMFANSVPIGSVSPASGPQPLRTSDTIRFSVFDRNLVSKDEVTYLTFWRQWWNQNQGQIQSLAAQAQ